MTHVGCWMTYYVHKARTECPICHRIYETQPPPPSVVITTFDISNRQPIRVVVVANEEIDNRTCKIIMKRCCLIFCIAFGLFFIIKHFV
jgi:hypothetical protein